MKIEGMPPIDGVKSVNRAGKVDKKTPAAGMDNVAVSGKAQLYQNLVKKVKELPDVREELVNTLAEQIAHGQYQVNVQEVAKKLLPDRK